MISINSRLFTINSVLLMIVFCFVFVFSILALTSPQKYTSPDESADDYFTKLYSKSGSLKYHEPLNSFTLNHARVRNSYSKDNYVSPATFPGFFIIFGTAGALNTNLIRFITPVIAAIGAIFIYLLTKCIFKDKKIGFYSALFLLFLPPYWLWSSATLFNNTASTVFLLGVITFFFLGIDTNKIGYYLAMACCLGLDHLFRTTDVTYFIPLFILFWMFRKEIKWKYLAISFFIYIVVVLPIFILNRELYGNIFSFGYGNPGSVVNSASGIHALLDRFKFFLLPSGFHPLHALSMGLQYIVLLVPIFIILVTVGILSSISDKPKVKKYLIFFSILSLWLLIYYGSGVYNGAKSFTLFASYIRYFLPIYVFAIPLGVVALNKLPSKIIIFTFIIFALVSSIYVYSSPGGLIDIRRSRESIVENNKKVLLNTESNSVIFTTFSDKYIFPDRKVVIYGPGYNDGTFTYQKLITMAINIKDQTHRPVYIFNDRRDLNITLIDKLFKAKNHHLEITNLDYSFKVV